MNKATDARRASGEAVFRRRLAEIGASLLDERYLGSRVPHRVRCAAGHEVTVRPNHVNEGGGACRTCAGRDKDAARSAFLAALAREGAILLEPAWLGTHAAHLVRCAAGHTARPVPGNVSRGRKICPAC